ncbi:hypothetical protein TNIN_474491 [Trichonephila inaurata madagascariensis]|uniref:Uncharacterized protein n=1 Tax=Trichonephila inaurata madagascariensis TaxID=2747483 RepID=A0A8X6XNZ8_9ARAC|nr:hypothetical protein TNIN_474491 [Trichonephila inaurata madagascariensis]
MDVNNEDEDPVSSNIENGDDNPVSETTLRMKTMIQCSESGQGYSGRQNPDDDIVAANVENHDEDTVSVKTLKMITTVQWPRTLKIRTMFQ